MHNWYDIFVQSIAIFALFFFVSSYQAKTRNRILLITIFGIILITIHFVLLKAWTGAFINGLNILITATFILKEKYKKLDSKILLYSAVTLLTLATFYSWEGFYSIFALVGILLVTIARWQNNLQHIRYIAIVAGLSWIAYDYFVGSIGGIAIECFILVSLIVSIVRGGKVKIEQKSDLLPNL